MYTDEKQTVLDTSFFSPLTYECFFEYDLTVESPLMFKLHVATSGYFLIFPSLYSMKTTISTTGWLRSSTRLAVLPLH